MFSATMIALLIFSKALSFISMSWFSVLALSIVIAVPGTVVAISLMLVMGAFYGIISLISFILFSKEERRRRKRLNEIAKHLKEDIARAKNEPKDHECKGSACASFGQCKSSK